MKWTENKNINTCIIQYFTKNKMPNKVIPKATFSPWAASLIYLGKLSLTWSLFLQMKLISFLEILFNNLVLFYNNKELKTPTY